MMWQPIGLVCALGFAAAAAQQPSTPPLWRDILAGDTPAQAAQKIAAIPGVKSAKARRDKVAIDYDDGDGIDIFGAHFAIVPLFVGGHVTRVGLIRRPGCIVDQAQTYNRIESVLREKYPDTPFPGYEITPIMFDEALSRAAAEAPATLAIGQYNAQTAVLFSETITKLKDPPSPDVGSTRGMRAAQALLWSQYQQQLEQCPQFQSYRLSYSIVYLTRAEFDSISQGIIKGATDEATRSNKNL